MWEAIVNGVNERRRLANLQAASILRAKTISLAARRPLAIAPWTVPLLPLASVASPAKYRVFSRGAASVSAAPSDPTAP